MTDKTISPLRQRMIEDIACPGPEPGVRGFTRSEDTSPR